MTIDEQARHQLFARLDEVLGRDEAATLMAHLPPVGWADVATRHDLDTLRLVVQADIGSVRTDVGSLRQRVDDLAQRTDERFDAMATRTDERFDAMTAVFDARFETFEHRILGEMNKAFRDQTLAFFWGNLGQLVALAGIVIAAVKL